MRSIARDAGAALCELPRYAARSLRKRPAPRSFEKCEGSSRIRAGLAPHAAYTCSAENLRRGMEACRRYGIPMTTHIAETLDEVRMIRERYGATPVEYLDSLGVLDGGLIAAHCVHLTDGIAASCASRACTWRIADEQHEDRERCRADRTAAHRRGELHGGHRRPQFEQRSGHVGGDAQRFVPAKGDDDGSLCRAGLRTAPHGDGLRCGRHRHAGELGVVKEGALADLVLLSTQRPYYHPRTTS